MQLGFKILWSLASLLFAFVYIGDGDANSNVSTNISNRMINLVVLSILALGAAIEYGEHISEKSAHTRIEPSAVFITTMDAAHSE